MGSRSFNFGGWLATESEWLRIEAQWARRLEYERREHQNLDRYMKALCKRLDFDPPARTMHASRHTFAVNCLGRCGGVFHLQRMLGHASLEMTRRYANLMTEDLQAVHQTLSLLGD